MSRKRHHYSPSRREPEVSASCGLQTNAKRCGAPRAGLEGPFTMPCVRHCSCATCESSARPRASRWLWPVIHPSELFFLSAQSLDQNRWTAALRIRSRPLPTTDGNTRGSLARFEIVVVPHAGYGVRTKPLAKRTSRKRKLRSGLFPTTGTRSMGSTA
jgi:hypothetical protein